MKLTQNIVFLPISVSGSSSVVDWGISGCGDSGSDSDVECSANDKFDVYLKKVN